MLQSAIYGLLLAAPAALAQVTAPAPAPAGAAAGAPTGPWAECDAQLETGTTNTLASIINGTTFQQSFNDGEASFLLPLVSRASAETQEVLTSLDQTGDGYTAIIPTNNAVDRYAGNDTDTMVPVLEIYNLTAADLTGPVINSVLRAHVLPRTVRYQDLSMLTQASADNTTTVESVQGYVWTFMWDTEFNEEGFLTVLDPETGLKFPIRGEAINTDKCPNSVLIVDGFLVTPDMLTTAEPPAPAPPNPTVPIAPPTTGSTTAEAGGTPAGESGTAAGTSSAATAAFAGVLAIVGAAVLA